MTDQVRTTDWLSVHRNHRLDATSPLIGQPVALHEQWRLFLGGRVRCVETVPSLTSPNQYDILIVDQGGIHRITPQGDTIWRCRPAGYWYIPCVGDIDEDGNIEVVATNGFDIHVLDSRTGDRLWSYQLPPSAGIQLAALTPYAFSGMRGIQLVVGVMYSTDLLIMDWQQGAHRGRVRVLHTDDPYHPALTVADMDNDGEEEIIVTKLCGIYQFSPHSGQLKKSYTWLSDGRRLRNYGLLQAIDVNQDGQLEIVILASLVARHLAVLGNDGEGNLSVWWDRYIEMIYPTDTTEVRWVMNSVADVNGDGQREIVVSLFNTRGDNRWWTEVINPQDGAILAEIPDTYLWDVQDADNDGCAEIFVSANHQRVVSPRGHLKVYRLSSFELPARLIWEDEDARYATRFRSYLPGLTAFRTDLLTDGEIWMPSQKSNGEFLIWKRDEPEHTRLVGISLSPLSPQLIAQVPNSHDNLDPAPDLLAMRDLDSDEQDEFLINSTLGELHIAKRNDRSIRVRTGYAPGARLGGSGYPSVPVAWRGHDGLARIAVHDLFNQIQLAVVDPTQPDRPRVLARMPGHGQFQVECVRNAAYAADINGDNQPEVICARPNPEGGSTLFAVDEDGHVVHEWDFRDIPAGDLTTRLGLYAWAVIDTVLVVSWYKSSSMNTEESLALSLSDDATLWHRPHVFDAENRRGFGPWSCAFTQDDQGLLFLAKDTMCHVHLRTGEWLHPPYTLRRFTEEAARLNPAQGMIDGFTAYGNIALHDVNSDGHAEYVILGCHGGFGVLDRFHNAVWWRVSIASDQVLRQGAVGDLDGDGKVEILISHIDGVIRCYAGSCGSLLWELPIGTRLADMAVCDIDGDGLLEAIGGGLDGCLYAIGNRQCDWVLDLGCSLSSVVIASLSNDAQPSILVSGADGYLHCLSFDHNLSSSTP